MTIELLDEAKDDLVAGYHFYEEQSSGIGSYFLDSLFADVDSLLLYAGIHGIVYGSHRATRQQISLRDLLPGGGRCHSRPRSH